MILAVESGIKHNSIHSIMAGEWGMTTLTLQWDSTINSVHIHTPSWYDWKIVQISEKNQHTHSCTNMEVIVSALLSLAEPNFITAVKPMSGLTTALITCIVPVGNHYIIIYYMQL